MNLDNKNNIFYTARYTNDADIMARTKHLKVFILQVIKEANETGISL